MKGRQYDCGLCGRPIAPKERYRRFQASVDGATLDRVGHVECIQIMGDAPPEQMWEEEVQRIQQAVGPVPLDRLRLDGPPAADGAQGGAAGAAQNQKVEDSVNYSDWWDALDKANGYVYFPGTEVAVGDVAYDIRNDGFEATKMLYPYLTDVDLAFAIISEYHHGE